MDFRQPPRLKQGDKIAIVSPSAGMPYLFPWVYEQGLDRLRNIFGLVPIEYPSARKSSEFLAQNPKARANDINTAFADPTIKGIIATTGGNDQINILPYLDKDVILSNPKIFMGFSDCTNLHLFLWDLGIISYYGGSIMSQFAQGGAMHDDTINSIKKALFTLAPGQIQAAPEYTDADLDWADKQNLSKKKIMYKSEGWEWHNCNNEIIQGRLWGGSLEILRLHVSTRKYLPRLQDLEGSILFLETSEEMPSEEFVYHFITTVAELGILSQMKAILMGYPKAQFCEKQPIEGREAFILNQKNAILSSLRDRKCNIPTIFNMNFGHTDPQTIIPNGGIAKIDCRNKTIEFK